MSGIIILFHAHDKVWKDRTIPLPDRIKSCSLIDSLVIKCLRGSC